MKMRVLEIYANVNFYQDTVHSIGLQLNENASTGDLCQCELVQLSVKQNKSHDVNTMNQQQLTNWTTIENFLGLHRLEL